MLIKRAVSRVSRVSAFAHSEEHLKEKTVHGGIVTLLGALLALTLFASEFLQCMSVKIDQQMEVDPVKQGLIHISFDITFPALPCQALRIDLGDISGKYQTEGSARIAHNGEIHKYQLDMFGRRLSRTEYIPPRDPSMDDPFVIILDDGDMASIREAVRHHEGCNVFGWFDVQRMGGNIHFSVKPSAMVAMDSGSDIIAALLARHEQLHGDQDHPGAGLLNVSHVIKTLRFGPEYPGQVFPLEGVSRIDRKAMGVDKYFIKVVPTEWRSLWGRHISTNQYSVTEYYTQLPPDSPMLPGFYLLYDTWPIAVRLKQRRSGLLHFLVRVCAVCGGVWALTGVVDKLVHRAVKMSGKIAAKQGPAA